MWTPAGGAAAALAAALAVAGTTGSAAARGQVVTGAVFTHTVARGETLRTLAARYGVDPTTVRADNGLSTAALKAGTSLRIDNRHLVPPAFEPQTIVINVPQRLLFVLDQGEPRAVPVAVGRHTWQTPIGAFTIVDRRAEPTWHVPPSILAEAKRAGKVQPSVVPPGPTNPLGKYWLGLSVGGIGLHGTNAPDSLYQAVTHGCIRLSAADIAWLFERTATGTAGAVIYQPVLLAAVDGDVLLESHPDVYRRVPEPARVIRELAADAGVSDQIDWDRAAAVLNTRAGVARSIRK